MKFLTINGKLQRDSSGRLITIPDNYDNSAITLNGKLLKTSGGLIGSNIIKRQLSTPSISLASGTTIQTDTIDDNATMIEVYADGTKIGEVAKQGGATKQTIDVSTLSGWESLASGNHSITIRTKASGYLDSASSNAVTVSKAASGYNVTFAGWTVEVDYGAFVRVYDAQSATGNYTSLPSNGGTVNCTSGYLYLEGNYGDTGYNDSSIDTPTVAGGVTIESIDQTGTGNSWILFKVTGDGTVGSFYMSCFIEGTQITLADGTTKAIEDITYDDELLVWNFYDGKFDKAKPSWIKVEEIAPRYNLVKFSDGREFGTVGAGGEKGYHRVFNKEAGAFTHIGTNATPIGTTTFADDGTNPTIISEEIIEKPVKYYNIITDKHYNIFANGILTSCRLSNKYHIKDMKYIDKPIIHEQEEKEYRERLEKNRKWLG